jgi:hypothetical protein
VAHACNPSTQEVEAGGLGVPGQARLDIASMRQTGIHNEALSPKKRVLSQSLTPDMKL